MKNPYLINFRHWYDHSDIKAFSAIYSNKAFLVTLNE